MQKRKTKGFLIIIIFNLISIVLFCQTTLAQDGVLQIDGEDKAGDGVSIEGGPQLSFEKRYSDPDYDWDTIHFAFDIQTYQNGQDINYHYYPKSFSFFNDSNGDGILNHNYTAAILRRTQEEGKLKMEEDINVDETESTFEVWSDDKDAVLKYNAFEYTSSNSAKGSITLKHSSEYDNGTDTCTVSFKVKFGFFVEYIEDEAEPDFTIKVTIDFYDFILPELFIDDFCGGDFSHTGLAITWDFAMTEIENYQLEEDERWRDDEPEGVVQEKIDYKDLIKSRKIEDKTLKIADKVVTRNEFDDEYKLGADKYTLSSEFIPNLVYTDIRDGLKDGIYYVDKYEGIIMDYMSHVDDQDIYVDPILHVYWEFHLSLSQWLLIIVSISVAGVSAALIILIIKRKRNSIAKE